jgi:hypothetical protein
MTRLLFGTWLPQQPLGCDGMKHQRQMQNKRDKKMRKAHTQVGRRVEAGQVVSTGD